MKLFTTLTAALFALVLAGTASAGRVVPIVMHDPGCHWFQVSGKLAKTLTVKHATAFINEDEAALRFAGPNGVKLLKVGKTLRITRKGVYQITMVGQAPDDNHLLLTVK